MKKQGVVLAAIALALLVAGCAGPNPLTGTAGTHGVAGFWAGLWHGIICPAAFVISLFNHNVHLYEVHNSGALYDLGFVLGLGMGIGSAGHGSGRGRKD